MSIFKVGDKVRVDAPLRVDHGLEGIVVEMRDSESIRVRALVIQEATYYPDQLKLVVTAAPHTEEPPCN